MPLQTIYTYSSMRSPLLYGDILGLAVYLYERNEFERFKNLEKTVPTGLKFSNTQESIPTIYLVIGESAYRKRMSLYGYVEKTTPFLDSLVQTNSRNIHFYDGIAIANITRDAVRYALSFATPFSKDTFWSEKNSIDLANEAGYSTNWISNQEKAGLYDNYPSYIARSSRNVFFESKIHKEDLDLITHLSTFHGKEKKQFIALHLMGSHFPFNQRFDEVDECIPGVVNTISGYDKSIHHTDRVLRELYNYTINKDESSIIVYFSDHGASPERGIHGLQYASVSEYEIPLVILTNNVVLDVDKIVSRYASESTGLVNNVNLSYILSEIMGYEVSEQQVEKVKNEGDFVLLIDGQICNFSALKDAVK